MGKIFIDTNIIVYSMDSFDVKKRDACRSLLKSFKKTDLRGVISTQVLQEFYVAATRKLGVDPIMAKNIMYSLKNFETIAITTELIMEAIDCSVTNTCSFWDALIIVAAQSAQCDELWTEDLNDGQIIRGVRIVNPLE